MVRSDVASDESVSSALSTVTNELRRDKLQLVGIVNNAGISKGLPIELEKMSEVQNVFNVNLFGMSP
jgi:short-subunit dehydrogenase